MMALGSFGWQQALRILRARGCDVPRPQPGFAHGAEATIGAAATAGSFPRRPLTLLGSYHPSQQNTFTGRLTREMLAAVFDRARELVEAPDEA